MSEVIILRREDGSSALEFGIVIPMIIMLVIGILFFSLTLYGYIVCNGAMRESARTIAITPEYTDYLLGSSGQGEDSDQIITIAQQVADDYIRDYGYTGNFADDLQITSVTHNDGRVNMVGSFDLSIGIPFSDIRPSVSLQTSYLIEQHPGRGDDDEE